MVVRQNLIRYTKYFDVQLGMEIFKDRIFAETKERLNNKGIEAILFDFDDTLIFTSEIFTKYMNEYITKVSDETGIEYKAINESLRRNNDEEYKKSGVNPHRWVDVVDKMTREFVGHENAIINNLDLLMKIYTEEPRIRPGARAVLYTLQTSGTKIGLVTHANTDWTWRKLNFSGMINYFDSILIADENGHKETTHWQSMMSDLGVIPEKCLVVGDSINSDIIPASKLGAKTMWVQNGSSWSVYRTGNVPDNTVVIDDIKDLLSAIDRLR